MPDWLEWFLYGALGGAAWYTISEWVRSGLKKRKLHRD